MDANFSRHAVIARHLEDVRWLARAPIPCVVVTNPLLLEGRDASAYLYYIVSAYSSLPDWTLFMHAHERAWHHALYSQLASMLVAPYAAGVGFLPVNHDGEGNLMLSRGRLPPAELDCAEFARLRAELLGLAGCGSPAQYPPCAQFWVHRDRITARPRAFYERLLQVLTDRTHPLLRRRAVREGNPNRTVHNYFLEGHWHLIFGEPEKYELPCRRFSQLPFITGRIVPHKDGSCVGSSCRRVSVGHSIEHMRLRRPSRTA